MKKMVQSSWKWLLGRHAQTNALRDDLKDNFNEDYDFALNYKSKEFITHTHTSVAHFAV